MPNGNSQLDPMGSPKKYANIGAMNVLFKINSRNICHVIWLLSFCFLISCKTMQTRNDRPHAQHQSQAHQEKSYDQPKLKPLNADTILKSPEQRQNLESYVTSLIEDQLIPGSMKITSEGTETDLFFKTQDIALTLLKKRYFLPCQKFIAFLKEAIFISFVGPSLELIDSLAAFGHTNNTPRLAYRLLKNDIDYDHTTFNSTLHFMFQAFSDLINGGHHHAALYTLDRFFLTYGSIEPYFDTLNTLTNQSTLRNLWEAIDPSTYESKPLVGYIKAQKIQNQFEQLQFPEVKRSARAFLRSHSNHVLAPEVSTLLDRVQRGASNQEWHIVALLPLSGPYGKMGKQILEGLTFTFKLFEPSHLGAPEKQIISVYPVDTHKFRDTLQTKVERLVQDNKISLIIGPLLTGSHKKIVPVIQKHRIPLLSLAPIKNKSDDLPLDILPIYKMHPSLQHQLAYMLSYIEENFTPIEQTALLYPSNGFGRFQAQTFQEVIDMLQLKLAAAETYAPKESKSHKAIIQQLLGIYDTVDRQNERTDFIESYKSQNKQAPRNEDVKLDPIIDFQVIFMPTSISRASIYIPLLKYFSVKNVVILGPHIWQNEELPIRTGPYLNDVIVFDTFFGNDLSPLFIELKDGFNKQYLSKFSRDHFMGSLIGSIVQKAFSNVGHTSFRKHHHSIMNALVGLSGHTPLNQRWEITKTGTLALDPIPLVIVKKRFNRPDSGWIAQFKKKMSVEN